ncbi:MAG: rhodanese-like domain-containing protein [Bacteroidetes bacterium]|nr:rhodanese-like domain-containing protein [Bacteroidota bacterium]
MEDITVQELKNRLDQGEALNIIDVREPWEYEEFNIGGKLISLGSLPEHLDELSDLKDAEIIVHCRSGARSATAKAFLTQQGFGKVRNMLGGIMDWRANFG